MTGLAAFGCFVELCPGRQGLCHVSELADTNVIDVSTVVKVRLRLRHARPGRAGGTTNGPLP